MQNFSHMNSYNSNMCMSRGTKMVTNAFHTDHLLMYMYRQPVTIDMHESWVVRPVIM